MLAEQLSGLFWVLSMSAAFATRFYFQPKAVMSVQPLIFWPGALIATGLIVRKFIAPGAPLPREMAARDLTGKVAIITGCATGLGLDHAAQLAKQGATVIVACRTAKRNEDAAAGIRERAGPNAKVITQYPLDLEDMASARAFVRAFLASGSRLDWLVLNGGLADFAGNKFSKAHPALDYSLTINIFSHLVLTELLDAKLKADRTRVVCLASYAHTMLRKGVTGAQLREAILHTHDKPETLKTVSGQMVPMSNYAVGKYMNVCHAHYLVSRGIDAVALHPGFVATSFADNIAFGLGKYSVYITPYLMVKTPKEGAATQIYATLADDKTIAPRSISGPGTRLIKKLARYCCDTQVMDDELTAAATTPEVLDAAMSACLEVVKEFTA